MTALLTPPEVAPVTLVSGFGRCGTSLVMQMLVAAGMPATGDATYPSYEDTRYLAASTDWISRASGSAVKVIDPHHKMWPAGDYRAIWLRRDHRQQALSTAKFLAVLSDRAMSRAERRLLVASYVADDPKAVSLLLKITSGRVLVLAFEDIIRDPNIAAARIGVFLGGLDVKRMASVVLPRPTGCHPRMMEIDLIKRGPMFPE